MLIHTLMILLALRAGTATCSVAQFDEIAPEAQASVDASLTGTFDYPRQSVVIDDRNGTVWVAVRRWLPNRCRPVEEDQVTVITPKGWYDR